MPLILTLGPMLTMAASACVTLTSTLQRISNKEATFKQLKDGSEIIKNIAGADAYGSELIARLGLI